MFTAPRRSTPALRQPFFPLQFVKNRIIRGQFFSLLPPSLFSLFLCGENNLCCLRITPLFSEVIILFFCVFLRLFPCFSVTSFLRFQLAVFWQRKLRTQEQKPWKMAQTPPNRQNIPQNSGLPNIPSRLGGLTGSK